MFKFIKSVVAKSVAAFRGFVNGAKNNAAAIVTGAVAVGAVFGGASNAHAQAVDPAADVVTKVQGITTTATTSWVAAVGLGVAILIVGVIVYVSKKGWGLKK